MTDPATRTAATDTDLLRCATPADEVDVDTVTADTLRASVRVSGLLDPDATALLVSVLHTHLTLGRRYVRVDLGRARLADDEVIDVLVDTHRAFIGLGGMLVFENAGPRMVDAIRWATLYVRPAC